MIHQAINLLELELENYITSIPANTEQDYVTPGNIAMLDFSSSEPTGMEDRVIISVVNIEEESAFKNLPNYIKTVNGTVRYQNAPVFLNLYLLFTSNFNNYTTALTHLSEVIQFFQSKNIFNLKNSPGFMSGNDLPDQDIAEMQLILNLYTMTFEQINHLWGSLGGKQIPFVLYKARLVKMLDQRTTGTSQLIEEVGVDGRGTSAASSQ